MTHEDYMRMALNLAREAMAEGEVPVGCVIVREAGKDALAHAELEAIRQANALLGGWRLHKAALYVTLEPCPMCAGGIINARIPQVWYGAADAKAGCCGSVLDLFAQPFNHHPQVHSGLLEEECAALLQAFFQRLRDKRRAAKPAQPPGP